MKKIYKFIKKNIKIVIAFSIGFILAGTSVYAANTIYARNVTYDNSNSGLSATNVQDALDETYNKCMPTATEKIINLYEDGSSITTVNIGGNTSNPKVKLNSNQKIMLDNNGNYRYYGANPNNYVEFNNETWRIIGSFYDVDDGTGKKETRLKIIRDESIGQYSWDSSASSVNSGQGVNDWSKSDLMSELNTLYYNSQSGTCYNGQNNASTTCNFTNTGLNSDSKKMIDNAIYYLGSSSGIYNSGSATVFNLYANEFYELERENMTYDCSENDGGCPRATVWTGKISLMYPSDYMYATDLSLCTKMEFAYNDNSCKLNNWLFTDDNYWTISSTIKYPHLVIGFRDVLTDARAYYSMAIKPVVYLKSDITITGGSGTSSDPYILR